MGCNEPASVQDQLPGVEQDLLDLVTDIKYREAVKQLALGEGRLKYISMILVQLCFSLNIHILYMSKLRLREVVTCS